MIILASTSDKLQIVTGSAGSIDAHVSWLDNTSGALAVSRGNAAITTATTTDIVASPASGVQRNVRSLYIRNKGGGSNAITVKHTDGTTAVELYKATLAADGQMQYNDGIGFAT